MRAVAIAVAAIGIAFPAFAADTPAPRPSCDVKEAHQLDFWLGDWKVTWAGGEGHTHVARALSGCVIEETFREERHDGAFASEGRSWSVYDVPNLMWRQTGVGNRGEYYDLTGGPKPDGTFILQIIRVGREPEMLRAVFEEVKADSFTWHWQGSDDGDAWHDKLVAHYQRIK